LKGVYGLELTLKEFRIIRDHIKENYGINMGDEKRSLVFSRLRGVMREMGFSNFGEYFNYVKSDKTGEAAIVFINRITTNHTFFMREAEHFEFLKRTALPWVDEQFGRSKDLRLWCAACSSGEEAYALQMVVQDFFESRPGWNTEILATDISEKVLCQASLGIYSNESIASMPKEWKAKYFNAYGSDNSAIKDSLKKLITFRKFNLMQEILPFKRPFQIIFCRNVMIYFDNQTKEKLINRLYNATEEGGYLFIGHSESLSNVKTNYKYIMPAVYRKN